MFIFKISMLDQLGFSSFFSRKVKRIDWAIGNSRPETPYIAHPHSDQYTKKYKKQKPNQI